MIFRRASKGSLPMFDYGVTYYHPVCIDNLVDATNLAQDAGEAFIIGDKEFFSIEDLVKRAGKAINVEAKTPHYPILPLIIADHLCEKMCKPLGINPPIFPRRVDWFRQVSGI